MTSNDSFIIQELRNAIAQAPKRPMVVKVSPDLMDALRKANLLKQQSVPADWKNFPNFSVVAFENVFVLYAPELLEQKLSFLLPPDSR